MIYHLGPLLPALRRNAIFNLLDKLIVNIGHAGQSLSLDALQELIHSGPSDLLLILPDMHQGLRPENILWRVKADHLAAHCTR